MCAVLFKHNLPNFHIPYLLYVWKKNHTSHSVLRRVMVCDLTCMPQKSRPAVTVIAMNVG